MNWWPCDMTVAVTGAEEERRVLSGAEPSGGTAQRRGHLIKMQLCAHPLPLPVPPLASLLRLHSSSSHGACFSR